MNNQRKTEEQLKTEIFTLYLHCIEETSSDRRQVGFNRIFEALIPWCSFYLHIKADEMGKEIFYVVQRLINGKNANIPKDENKFFMYLKKALYTTKNEYDRNNQTIQTGISRDNLRKLKAIDTIIAMKEGNLGRKLTGNERIQCISQWLPLGKYIELINDKNASGLDIRLSNNNDEEMSLLDMNVKSIFSANASTEYQASQNEGLEIKNALELALNKTQKRSRECYRSLFTAYCIDNSAVSESLLPLLDNDVIDKFVKDKVKPKQYEIYQKHHPEAAKASAEAMASKMASDFIEKMKNILNKK